MFRKYFDGVSIYLSTTISSIHILTLPQFQVIKLIYYNQAWTPPSLVGLKSNQRVTGQTNMPLMNATCSERLIDLSSQTAGSQVPCDNLNTSKKGGFQLCFNLNLWVLQQSL